MNRKHFEENLRNHANIIRSNENVLATTLLVKEVVKKIFVTTLFGKQFMKNVLAPTLLGGVVTEEFSEYDAGKGGKRKLRSR